MSGKGLATNEFQDERKGAGYSGNNNRLSGYQQSASTHPSRPGSGKIRPRLPVPSRRFGRHFVHKGLAAFHYQFDVVGLA